MSIRIDIGLGTQACEKNSEVLCSLLADEYLLYLKTLNFHWNITGDSFISLHQLLENQYEWVKTVVDALAERVRALGHIAPGSYKEYMEKAHINEGNEQQTAHGMLVDLVKSHESVIKEIRNAICELQESQDFATVDMLIKLLGQHEHNAWMLRSHLLSHPD